MPEPKDHYQQRGWLETLLRYIPGFRGYLEREYRREADQLYRHWIADRLRQVQVALDRLAADLTEQGKLDALGQVQRLGARLDHLRMRIQGAVHGYSGFFDLVQITEETLDRVYQHDASVAQQAEALFRQSETLSAQGPQWPDRLRQMALEVDQLHRSWDAREQILQGLL